MHPMPQSFLTVGLRSHARLSWFSPVAVTSPSHHHQRGVSADGTECTAAFHVKDVSELARGIAFAINKLWKAGPTQWGRAQHQQNRPLGSVRSPPLAESPGGHSDGLPPAALLARARSATIAHGARSTTSTVRAAVACTRCCSKEATAGWLSAMAPARAAGLRCSVVAACFVAAIEAP